MANPNVYEVGRIQPEGEPWLIVGVDYEEVALKGDVTLSASEQEEFAQLYVHACHLAARAAERLQADAPECPHVWGYVGVTAGVEVYRCETCQALHATEAIR